MSHAEYELQKTKDLGQKIDDYLAASRQEVERLAGGLAACGVAAMCDDAESAAKWRITSDNPFSTDSYKAVVRCVEQVMAQRTELASLQSALAARDAALDVLVTAPQVLRAAAKWAHGHDLRVDLVRNGSRRLPRR